MVMQQITVTPTIERYVSTALLGAANFKEIGINVKIVQVRWPELCKRSAKPETAFHLALFKQPARYAHPQFYLIYYTPEGWGTT